MLPARVKSIIIFFLGMLTFAIGYFIVSTFIIVERPTMGGIIEDWEKICFWPDESGIHVAVSPKGCYSTTCTRPTLQAGTAIINLQEYDIRFESRFVIVETSRFPLPCTENCAGGGTVQFNLGNLIPNNYDVRFRDDFVGELSIFSGIPTPRQCFENTNS